MHLLSAQVAATADVETAVDLEQSPGEIVVLSAADTELACLAAAHARLGEAAPSVRLASILRLTHPLSVDLHVERVVSRARLVIVRLLGGRGYWAYGIEQVATTCREHGILLACLPGDDKPDPELARFSTLPENARERLWRYLLHGGIDNAEQALRYAASLLGRDLPWREPQPLPRAGLYHPALPSPDLANLLARWQGERPRAILVFYRALVQSGDLAPIEALLHALDAAGLDAAGLFVTSLKDPEAAALAEAVLAATRPAVVLNATAFAVGKADGGTGDDDPLAAAGAPVLQVVLAGSGEEAWRRGTRGLGPRDLAMSVALPEVDGRILARAVSFKALIERDPRTEADLVLHRPVADRIAFTAELAAAWARLRTTPKAGRRVAILLANYPNRDGRLANGVGLDTPASCIEVLRALAGAGYTVTDIPEDGDALIRRLAAGPTNDLAALPTREVRVSLPLARYRDLFAALPVAVRVAVVERWGEPERDPHLVEGAFALPLLPLGNIVVGIQPARGYHIDPAATYHAPDLVPPHAYLACYLWLRHVFGAHAIVHLGKHGNLEWLPGKATALSAECFPEAALGPLPHLYPFIVNDPGEGTQAKRRTSAVIVDHLTPPLTRAESHGQLAELELLVDEYYEAANLDPRRLEHLRGEILARSESLGLAHDLGIARDADPEEHLARLDNHLCELKELQIRDGLHVLGRSPVGEQLADLLVALLRLPRGRGEGADASILCALAADLGLAWNPLGAELGAVWQGPRPAVLREIVPGTWRTMGDTVERLELLAKALVAGTRAPDPAWAATRAVLDGLEASLRPAVAACGTSEIAAVLQGLDGRRIAPGPSGAPTRGRPEVLPTGRNFYSVDCRAVPTPAAWHLGWKSAELVLEHHLQTQGFYPRHIALSAWGTANMRTGGDDIAQALALMGCRPVWDAASKRVTGVEVLPLSVLGRPRVDVTLRVSGFFRDAFPVQLELLDDAVRAVAALDEPPEMNPLAATAHAAAARLEAAGLAPELARRRATTRIFGSRPGAYGAGLQALIDERGWNDVGDLAGAWLAWGGYAYGRGEEGRAAVSELSERLSRVELVLHNQDNREHDLLDSDDYYQFEGGLAATVRHLSGRQPEIYHNDHSRPEFPRVRTLKEEIGRIVRGRAANPKWIRGVMRHGYKGAFEIAATVDYLFAFAATAAVVEDHHFDALFDAYLQDEEVRDFLARHNPAALREIAERFDEAVARGLWRPRRNSASALLDELKGRDRASG
ncbi:cobaltochelatase subunit CobN [Benzoatithermus flavus]|uniref:Cobaltochelatase subunit CobN n=1 Tax=Benzoatithermus flavus TaxID=3108223 RepID=A0ABU8XY96_9PROT